MPILNYFNRVPAPRNAGYSVRVTHARDWRGTQRTYDGHLGTDFVVPVGTAVVAAAPGVVLRVGNDWLCGGRKVCIDHGGGLITTYNHLSQARVRVGERVSRAAAIGLSGASGAEFLAVFPWLAPHLHFNVWLDGKPIDPFAAPGESSLWREGNDPAPAHPDPGEPFDSTEWNDALIARAIRFCRDQTLRRRVARLAGARAQACELLLMRAYRPLLFSNEFALYVGAHVRSRRLSLPFAASDYVGVVP